MSYIFLSHSHADKPFVRKLASDLRAAGHSVWVDEAELNIGDSLIGKIREGLDQVDYVAAVLSKDSIGSDWVNKELEIASNREIEEKKVIVLPLLLEKVDLPGFLKGKFYGDFSNPDSYKEKLDLLLRAVGNTKGLPEVSSEEIVRLKEALESAQALAETRKKEVDAHRKIALRGKSKKLVEAIKKADIKFPLYTPINTTYAFELSSIPVTLDYLLWVIRKVEREGAHPMEMLLSLNKQWDEAAAMLAAYKDLLDAIENE